MTRKKHPKSEVDHVIAQRQRDGGAAYVSWEDNPDAFITYADALEEGSHNVTTASHHRNYSGLTNSLSGRPGLQNADFNWFRPDQAIPTKPKDIIAYARYVYRTIGLIHNAFDLMSDFACQGVRLAHPNARVEKFYNDWFKSVEGKHVSERIGHLLFREGNLVLRSYNAKINASKRKDMHKSVGAEDALVDVKNPIFKKKEIPWRYTFIDTLLVNPIGGSVAGVSNKKIYSLKIPQQLKSDIKKLQASDDPAHKELLKEIAPDILRAVNSTQNVDVILPSDKTHVLHYKKDDWQAWADPIVYSAFEDLNLYQRLKLADKAALDGAISKIRVWKLGSLEHKLAPTPTASSTLADMLGANVGGGTIDIIWGPDIELIETSSDMQSFLGEEKYRPTLMALYSCIGIPPTLTGTFGASGTTNNFISLKTLTERLNYVRGIIVKFWDEQIKAVQKAMGFRFPAQIEFDHMYLDDPAAMGGLLLNMADRNIVSEEFVQRFMKAKPNIESNRISSEKQKRTRKKMHKVSPFHNANKEHELHKIALQTGLSTPSEVGLELEEKKDGEKSALEMKEAQMNKTGRPPDDTGKTGTPGRPKNSKDGGPRKQKTFKPKTKASADIWAKEAQTKLSSLLNPPLLARFKKKTLRSLTALELNEVERIKFEILCNLSIGEEVDKETITTAVNKQNPDIHREFDLWIADATEVKGSKLTIEQVRDLRVSYYINYKYGDL